MDRSVSDFFGWNTRRIWLKNSPSENPKDFNERNTVLDVEFRIGDRKARLISYSDPELDYVILALGDLSGKFDVSTRIVGPELIIIEGSRSHSTEEILIATFPRYANYDKQVASAR